MGIRTGKVGERERESKSKGNVYDPFVNRRHATRACQCGTSSSALGQPTTRVSTRRRFPRHWLFTWTAFRQQLRWFITLWMNHLTQHTLHTGVAGGEASDHCQLTPHQNEAPLSYVPYSSLACQGLRRLDIHFSERVYTPALRPVLGK